jgi:hypothetical protein
LQRLSGTAGFQPAHAGRLEAGGPSHHAILQRNRSETTLGRRQAQAHNDPRGGEGTKFLPRSRHFSLADAHPVAYSEPATRGPLAAYQPAQAIPCRDAEGMTSGDRLSAFCVAPWSSLPPPRHTSHDGGASAGPHMEGL